MKEIRENIDEIAENKSKFHFKERSFIEEGVTIKREPTYSFVHSSDVIGREGDKENLINFLMSSSDDENVSIIPIVGIGGLGKTTLAQLVYNDSRVVNYFHTKIWICVSEDFSVSMISRKVMEAVDLTVFGLDIDLLQILLRERLKTVRYLIVLDDVWNEDKVKWVYLKELLMGGLKGSKIIVTTRIRKAASMMGTINPYSLKGLPDDKCLDLLLRWAFDKHEERPPNLVSIARKMICKCGGLPLAARTLGCLLYKEKKEQEWLSVLNSEMWELPQKENDILPVLRLTYDQMPSYLKQCFAFCSLFPKDCIIDKEILIYLWMAQGFLRPSDRSQQLEHVGNRYFNELVSRSLLEGIEGNDGEVKQCKMHDLIHDLAQSVAGTECSIITTHRQNFTERVRHLSIFVSHLSGDYSSKNKVQILEILSKTKKLRTLFSPSLDEKKSATVINFLANLKYLRILDLSGSEFDSLPSSIGDLLHLRYLDLSKNQHIKRLPSSICNLRNLQKLKLYGCVQLIELPKDTWKITSLRHLEITLQQEYLPKKGIEGLTSLHSFSIHDCNHLSSLLEGMQHLTTLQTLRLCDCPRLTSLKFSLNSLISLETLEICNCLDLDDLNEKKEKKEEDGWSRCNTLQPIRGLNYRKANLEDKQKRKDGGEEEGEQSFEKLRSLNIVQLPKLVKLPEGLKNATSLQYLSISECSRLSSLPEGMQCLTTLQTLRLCDCPMISSLKFSLNSLISLENLEIRNCLDFAFMENQEKKEEDVFKGHNHDSLQLLDWEEKGEQGLEKLQSLSIVQLPKLVKLPEELKQATSLRCLSISDCSSLSSLPEGMRCLNTLQTLQLCACPSVTSLNFSLNSLISLETLEICNCLDFDFRENRTKKEEDILKGHNSLQLPELEEEENGHDGLEKLCSLIISQLPKVVKLPEVFKNVSTRLQHLCISDCNSLSCLPKEMQHLTALRTLRICDCPKLTSLPFGLNSLIPLETLEIRNCLNLDLEEVVEDQLGHEKLHPLTRLNSLTFAMLPKLVKLPKVLKNAASSLQHLSITDCNKLSSLPDGMQRLTALKTLCIGSCPKLRSITFCLNSLVSLETLEIRNCSNLDLEDEDGQQGFGNLRTLIIFRLPKLVKLPQLLKNAATTLQYVSLSYCDKLSFEPSWFKNFKSHQKLEITNCPIGPYNKSLPLHEKFHSPWTTQLPPPQNPHTERLQIPRSPTRPPLMPRTRRPQIPRTRAYGNMSLPLHDQHHLPWAPPHSPWVVPPPPSPLQIRRITPYGNRSLPLHQHHLPLAPPPAPLQIRRRWLYG